MTPEEYKRFSKMPREYKNGLVYAINDHFENNKSYNIPRAQLIIADIPYNLSANAFASNPMWYKDGDNKNGESELAGKSFFNTDEDFRVSNLFHFCSRLLKDEPKEKTGKTGQSAPCMIVFCAFQQMHNVIECAKQYGFVHYIPLQWYKNYSAQVLKANMKVVENTEYAILFYKNKLPKFNNNGLMVFNNKAWIDDPVNVPKIHPTQKPIGLLKQLILLHTDPSDCVIDPCCGSGSTLAAAAQCGRKAIGFEIDKHFFYEMTHIFLPEVLKIRDLF